VASQLGVVMGVAADSMTMSSDVAALEMLQDITEHQGKLSTLFEIRAM
jgi:hypothetical protein